MKDSKSDQILDAAIKVFAEKGYHYATIAEVAKQAGVSKGLVHFYFENKLDLLLSVLLLFWKTVNRMNQEKLSQAQGIIEQLIAVFTTFQDLLLRDEKSLHWGKILNEGLPQQHLIKSETLRQKRQEINAENRRLLGTIDQLITEGQRTGEISKEMKPQVMRQVLGGASQFLTTGMYLQLYRDGAIGYNAEDVRSAMEDLINKFKTFQ